MAEFPFIVLDEQDVERAKQIMAGVKSVVSLNGAVSWALKNAEIPHSDHDKPIPMALDRHFVAAIPMRRLAQLDHTLVIDSAALELLAPDKKKQAKLLRDDVV